MEKVQLLESIKKRLKEKGVTAASASVAATGSRHFIANIGRERYGMPSIENLSNLCDVLDLELYFGPPRPKAPVPPVVIDSREYLPVPQYDAHLSAGDGVFNLNAEPIDHLAFSKTWMAGRGLKADKAILVSVRGDSMQPAICNGDLVIWS